MDPVEALFVEFVFRWTHVVAAIVWVGMGLFLDLVHGPFSQALDRDTKRRALPALLPRALAWWRWGAVVTWTSGLLLLAIVYYHGQMVAPDRRMVAVLGVTFGAAPLYDGLCRTIVRRPLGQLWTGVAMVAGAVVALDALGLGLRPATIHVGVLMGTVMALNVWVRIWPAQRTMLEAIRAGTAPDPTVVALAGARTRQNTYLALPVVATMLGQHALGWIAPMGDRAPVAVVAMLAAALLAAHALVRTSRREALG